MPPIVTLGDVKTAARESGKTKWQEMWDKTEKGRHLFNNRNTVGLNLVHKYKSTKGEISIIQLRTGYVRLNEYLQKTNVVESNKCQCRHIESISHYLLECPLYENQREKLRRILFEICGIAHLDLNLLLDVKTDDDYKEWRTLILSELETFVAETKRFATRPSCLYLQYRHHQMPRDNTSVDSIDLAKIPVCLYGLKTLYRNTEPWYKGASRW